MFRMLRHTIMKPLSHWTATVLRVGRKTVLKQSQVIRNFLACVPKWHKVVAKMFNIGSKFYAAKYLTK